MTKRKIKKPRPTPVEVFYVRKSEKLVNGSDETEYENQLSRMRERWGDLPVHTENISGGKKRAVLNRLLETLPEGSTIYVAHIDRLSRAGIFDFLSIVEQARERKISVISMHDGDTDLLDQNPLFLAMKAYIAEQERHATSRRMKDAIKSIRYKKYDGKWGGGRAKELGTHNWGTKPVNPLWEEAMPYLLELRAQGLSYAKIAERASEKYGEKFSTAHVHRLLTKRISETSDRLPTPRNEQTLH
jgi:DNA invertase Pin-like site-specific DNA recombinase